MCRVCTQDGIRFVIDLRLVRNFQSLSPINSMQHQVGRFALLVLGGHVVHRGRGRCGGKNKAN